MAETLAKPDALFDVSYAAFESAYAERAGKTVAEMRAMGKIVMPCFCGADDCDGWQSVSARSVAFDALLDAQIAGVQPAHKVRL